MALRLTFLLAKSTWKALWGKFIVTCTAMCARQVTKSHLFLRWSIGVRLESITPEAQRRRRERRLTPECVIYRQNIFCSVILSVMVSDASCHKAQWTTVSRLSVVISLAGRLVGVGWNASDKPRSIIYIGSFVAHDSSHSQNDGWGYESFVGMTLKNHSSYLDSGD